MRIQPPLDLVPEFSVPVVGRYNSISQHIRSYFIPELSWRYHFQHVRIHDDSTTAIAMNAGSHAR
jgi:hypothetical protein